MVKSGIFNRLVSELSLDERHNILERLKGQSALSDEPLYFEDRRAAPAFTIEIKFSELPWYYHLWYVILSFFKSQPPVKIFENHQVSILGGKIEGKTPGLYDCQRGMLQPSFYRLTSRLKEAAHFFYSALDMSVNRDRGAFFAFLGSLEMPDVHKRLQEETAPGFYVEKYPDIAEKELRQMAYKAMEDAFVMITEDHRDIMYFDARSLQCLMELSSFLYDRLLNAFDNDITVGGETCPAAVVKELLVSLNDILRSLKEPPPMTLLESLFVFILQEKAGEPGFNIHREIHLLLNTAESSLAFIREFNRHVPLTWILRCCTRDMSFLPGEISGGEDWFAVYQDYWRRKIESLIADFIKERHRQELFNSFNDFLKGNEVKTLQNTQTDSNPEGLPIKGAFALSFLFTFYSAVFMPDMNWVLRVILLDGEFQKKENRVEYTESYNILIKLEGEIKKLEKEISPAGDYGKRYDQAKQEMSPLPTKRRKLQIISEEASEDAKKILDQVRDASINMVNLLTGILGKGAKGKYFTLTNFSKISGKDNQVIGSIGAKIQQFQIVLKILDDIEVLENTK